VSLGANRGRLFDYKDCVSRHWRASGLEEGASHTDVFLSYANKSVNSEFYGTRQGRIPNRRRAETVVALCVALKPVNLLPGPIIPTVQVGKFYIETFVPLTDICLYL